MTSLKKRKLIIDILTSGGNWKSKFFLLGETRAKWLLLLMKIFSFLMYLHFMSYTGHRNS